MAAKFVFDVHYEQQWEEGEDTSGRKRVSVDRYDAQLAVEKVKKMVIGEESDFLMADGENFAKCVGFTLTSVEPVSDYEE